MFIRIQNLLLVFLFVITTSGYSTSKLGVEKVREAIKAKGATWTAGETTASQLTREQQKGRLGLVREEPDSEKLGKLPPAQDLPFSFSWRDNGGDFVTPVRDQGQCGSCSYFSTLAVVEANERIRTNNPKLEIDLSEQYILSCGSVGNCDNGASIRGIFRYMMQYGTVSEKCFPYGASDVLACSNACPAEAHQYTKIGNYMVMDGAQVTVEDIKNAVYHRPVSVAMAVYEDFNYYIDGVYEHVEGELDGYHAVLLYGWDDAEQSWLCKNSWGVGWGNQGHFRIKWGESEIAFTTVMLWDEPDGAPRMDVSPLVFDVQLSPGESTTQYLTVANRGDGNLEFVAEIDAIKMPQSFFHQTDVNSTDGQVWWAGSEKYNGYDNDWWQRLDTPVINLSTAKQPLLQFDAFWALDSLNCDVEGYDGWDGWNIQVSQNNGRNFQTVEPRSAKYNCTSLYAFGETWNFGYGIPGFGGTSGEWTTITVELSDFKSAQNVVRFSFASNSKNCSRDNSQNNGLFIDNVKILDGDKILFSDSAELNSSMQTSGNGGEDVRWLTLPYSTNHLAGGEVFQIPLHISATKNASGFYLSTVNISNNHRQNAPTTIVVNLNVAAPQNDLGLGELINPAFEWPLLMNFASQFPIHNWGNRDQQSVLTSLDVFDVNGNRVASVGTVIPSIPAGKSAFAQVPVTSIGKIGEYEIQYGLDVAADDENSTNNQKTDWIKVTNLVDDFEVSNNLWDLGDTWGRTEKFTGGHDSPYAVHINNGDKYENNIKSSLSLRNGFNFSDVESAKLVYWSRYALEKNKDFVHVQVKNGESDWATLASHTSSALRWKEYNLDLTDFCGSGFENVQVRFLFTSDEQGTAAGFFMDDVSIFINEATGTEKLLLTSTPQQFQLDQNYPNPFNPNTTISYHLPQAAFVSLQIVNMQGQVVDQLLNNTQHAGTYQVTWNAGNMASGVYFYRFEYANELGEKFSSTKKMLLIK